MRAIFVILSAFLLISCAKKDEKIKLFLDWTPNTNHTGIFVAKELGYYNDLGIDIDILLPGKTTAEAIVGSNQAHFGISFESHLIEARDKGVPIVSIAALLQHSTSGYASAMHKNIKTPKDFVGKTYGAYGSQLEKKKLELIMKKAGVENPQINFVMLGNSDFFMASKKEIDFINIFYGWTGIESEIRNYPINYIDTVDYAPELDTYEPIIITSEKLIKTSPELIASFLKATKKGYQFAIDNPDLASEILLKLNPELSSELVKKSQIWLNPRYIDDADFWGDQQIERWQKYIDFMCQNRIIENNISARDAINNSFVESL